MRLKCLLPILSLFIDKTVAQFEPYIPDPGNSNNRFWNDTGWQMFGGEEAAPLKTVENSTDRRQLNVFLPDGRSVMTDSDMETFPISTVGMVKKSSYCTGTLVARDVILTNRHCVEVNSEGILTNDYINNGYFYLSWENNRWHRRSSFTNKSVVSTSQAEDWALLVLKDALGDEVGWVGMKNKERDSYFAQENRLINMISYSGDYVSKYKRGGFQRNCSTRGLWGRHSLHDCDATRGSSGSAILEGWEKPYVIGVNYGEFRYPSSQSLVLGEYTRERANVFDPSFSFYDDMKRLRGPPTAAPTSAPTPCWKVCKRFKKRRTCNAQRKERCKCRWKRIRRGKYRCKRGF
jgi:V8-like Glu-specific endopeptidase